MPYRYAADRLGWARCGRARSCRWPRVPRPIGPIAQQRQSDAGQIGDPQGRREQRHPLWRQRQLHAGDGHSTRPRQGRPKGHRLPPWRRSRRSSGRPPGVRARARWRQPGWSRRRSGSARLPCRSPWRPRRHSRSRSLPAPTPAARREVAREATARSVRWSASAIAGEPRGSDARRGDTPAAVYVNAPGPEAAARGGLWLAARLGGAAPGLGLGVGACPGAGEHLRSLVLELAAPRQLLVATAEVGTRRHRPRRAAGAVVDVERIRGLGRWWRRRVRHRCHQWRCRVPDYLRQKWTAVPAAFDRAGDGSRWHPPPTTAPRMRTTCRRASFAADESPTRERPDPARRCRQLPGLARSRRVSAVAPACVVHEVWRHSVPPRSDPPRIGPGACASSQSRRGIGSDRSRYAS